MRQAEPTVPKIRLRTRDLELVLAIADLGNLQRAAASLHMSQPAGSKLVSQIEAMFGTPLFDRNPRGLMPNLYGASLIRHARAAVSEVSEAGRDIAALKRGQAGSAKIEAIMTPALEVLAPAAASLQATHPGVDIVIEVGTSRFLVDRLQGGELDVVIARVPPEVETKHFDYEPIGPEPLCFLCRPDHELAQKRKVTVEDLADRTWVLQLRGSVLRRKVDAFFLGAGLRPPERVVQSESFEIGLAIVLASNTLMVASGAIAEFHGGGQRLRLLPFDQPFNLDEYGLLRMRGRPLSPASEAMVEQIRLHSSALRDGSHRS